MRNVRLNCLWLKLARLGVDGMNMQRILTAGLVLLAVAFSAGGVAFSVRADSSQGAPAAAAKAPAPAQDQCSTMSTRHEPVRINAKAAELAAKDDTVPLNTQGYNYSAYENQWRPEPPKVAPNGAAVPALPAAPAKP